MNNYGTPPLTLVRGEGAEIWDDTGKRYLDLYAGIAVNVLGHAHPAIVEAVTRQVQTLGHTSNFFITEPALALAERLKELLAQPSARVLLCNSGTEANEAAFKIARRTGRPEIIACEGAFHGRTMGALALTGQPAKREPFEPMPGGVSHIPFGDLDALDKAVDRRDGGRVPGADPRRGRRDRPAGGLSRRGPRGSRPSAARCSYWTRSRPGIGRTGAWFAHQPLGITPDVVTLAKGLGGGLPIGACVGIGEAAGLLEPGQHGTTFGGNPVSCAAALAVLDTVASQGLLEHVSRLGKELRSGIEALGHPLVADVSGAGLHIGIGLTEPVSAEVAAAAREAGYLVNNAVPDRVRLAPALTLSDDQAREFLEAFPAILDRAKAG